MLVVTHPQKKFKFYTSWRYIQECDISEQMGAMRIHMHVAKWSLIHHFLPISISVIHSLKELRKHRTYK